LRKGKGFEWIAFHLNMRYPVSLMLYSLKRTTPAFPTHYDSNSTNRNIIAYSMPIPISRYPGGPGMVLERLIRHIEKEQALGR